MFLTFVVLAFLEEGQVEGNVVLVAADDAQEFKLVLMNNLKARRIIKDN